MKKTLKVLRLVVVLAFFSGVGKFTYSIIKKKL